LAAELIAFSAMAAPPICGRHECREEIDACVDSQCEALSGSARAQCKKECVAAVTSACDEDPVVCNPSATTTTEATTTSEPPTSEPSTSSTSTTLIGSPSGTFVE
jgi:hypothetical protein